MLNKEIYQLFRKNPAIGFEELLFDYETFEEPPLFNRLEHAKPFLQYLKREDLNTFFFNLALSHLTNVKLYAKKILTKQQFDNFFICLTYTEEDIDAQENGFYIPNFFVSRKEDKFQFNNKITKETSKLDITTYPIIEKTLKDLNLLDFLDVYHSKWFDDACQEYIQRFYFYKKTKEI